MGVSSAHGLRVRSWVCAARLACECFVREKNDQKDEAESVFLLLRIFLTF
jgi:hypothetical protein